MTKRYNRNFVKKLVLGYKILAILLALLGFLSLYSIASTSDLEDATGKLLMSDSDFFAYAGISAILLIGGSLMLDRTRKFEDYFTNKVFK